MNDKIIKHSENLNHYNLNFVTDNFKVTIHNFMAETFQYVDGYDFHQHSCYELHYIKQGSGTIEFNDTVYTLNKGHLCLLSPQTQHKQIVHNHSMIEYALRFSIEKLQPKSKNKTIISESECILQLLERNSNQLFEEQYDFEQLFEASYQEAYDKTPGYYVTIKQLIMSIIIKLARLSINNIKASTTYHFPTRSNSVTQMELLSQFIRDNINSNITNSILSTYVHMSERQLHRLIKKETGLAPHQYVSQLRVNYVKKLLNLNTYTLKAISEMVGYSSEFHLSSAFKKHTGLTPTEYIHKSDDLYELDENSTQRTIQLF